MKKIIKYVADDGKEFHSEEACLDYEKGLRFHEFIEKTYEDSDVDSVHLTQWLKKHSLAVVSFLKEDL